MAPGDIRRAFPLCSFEPEVGGLPRTEVDGREKVTHMYHQVQNEVKMLRRREGAMASAL